MKKATKALAFILLSLLVTVPALVGCGSASQGANEVQYGWIWDFTGRAASAVTQTYDGFRDYIRMVSEEDPIPGINIKLLIYDTQSDVSKVPIGYEWMKNAGADILSAAPQDTELLRSRFESDQIPFYALSNLESMTDCQLLTTLYGPPQLQLEVQLEWIAKNWTGYPTKPRIGFIGLTGVAFYVSQEATVREWTADHADQFEWLGSEMVPSTTSSWATEVLRFKNADFIFASMSGPPLASLVKEARARGFAGKFMGPSETYFSFYMLLRSAMSPDQLNNIVAGTYTPWWTDASPFMTEVEEYYRKYHGSGKLDSIQKGTGQFNGWAAGMIFVDAVRRAAKEVGAEKVDGLAIHKALQETDLTVEGWGNPWKLPGNGKVNYFAQTVRLVQYDSSIDNWKGITDYIVPPFLR